jgi:hypothetical protein
MLFGAAAKGSRSRIEALSSPHRRASAFGIIDGSTAGAGLLSVGARLRF